MPGGAGPGAVARWRCSPTASRGPGTCRSRPAPDLVFDFLKVEWRTIQHYGVEIGGLRYDGPALNGHRNQTSPYGGKHAGRWPLRVDPGDVSRVWFQDPADDAWHALQWEHADALGAPFSSEALDYARQLAAATHRFPDTRRALAELLEQWGAGLAGDRAERRMALRLSEQRLRLVPDPPPAAGQAPASPPCRQRGRTSSGGEPGAPFPGEEPGGDPGDFYADAMETV